MTTLNSSQMDNLHFENIVEALSNPRTLSNVSQCRMCLSMVMNMSMSRSCDMTLVIPTLVNLMAHSDLLIKKAAGHLLSKCTGVKSDLTILAVNTLLKDTKDSNPTIRGLAIHIICSMKHEAFVEHRIICIQQGLGDSSAYVRRNAVLACVTVGRNDPSSIRDSGLIDQLYAGIRDQDPIVSVNSMLALEEILSAEGGIVLNKKIVAFILSRFEHFTVWGMAYILNLLLKYKPSNEDEIFDLMNILDPYLENNCTTLAFNALQLFLSLTQDMPHLTDEVFHRTQSVLLSVFSSGNPEMVTVVIQFFNKYCNIMPKVFSSHYRNVFCTYKDPVYLKVMKISFVFQLINVENFKDIFEEIFLNCKEKNKEVSLCAIQALGQLIVKFTNLSESLLGAFKKLLISDTPHVVSNSLQVLVTLPSDSIRTISELEDQICDIGRSVKDAEGMTSVLFLLGRIDGNSKEIVYVIEDFVANFCDLNNQVKGQLLITTIKMFYKRPAEFQAILGQLIELCLNDNARDLKDEANLYYSLLRLDYSAAKMIMSNI